MRKTRTASWQIRNHGRPSDAAILGAHNPREVPAGIANGTAAEEGDVFVVGIDLDHIVVPALELAYIWGGGLNPGSAAVGGEKNAEIRSRPSGQAGGRIQGGISYRGIDGVSRGVAGRDSKIDAAHGGLQRQSCAG